MPDRPSLPVRPDRAALLRWLGSDAVVSPHGEVWSWHNPEHPGYLYPEAGGLWLALMAREPETPPTALDRVAAWLGEGEQRGTIGRDGTSYLFDRGMVLAGRLAWARRRGTDAMTEHDTVLAILDDLEAQHPTSPPLHGERWSRRFGPHLLKLALPLSTWAERHETRPSRALDLSMMLTTLGPTLDDGRVLTTRPEEPTYLHAHCYAAEGLWRLSTTLPDPLAHEARALAERAASWLASVQRPDGGLPPWHDGERGWGSAPADVAAQAVRLWCGLDRTRHRDAIDRALAFLGRLSRPGGGMRYHEHSDDQNTWATLFTVQALDFARGEVDVRALV